MNPILDKFEQKLCQVQFAPLRLPLASNLTGEILQPGEMLGLSYWNSHLRSSVQFASGIQALAAQGYDLFIEIGSDPTLINMGKRCLTSENITWLPSLKKEQDDWQILLNSLGELYIKGVNIDWAGLDLTKIIYVAASLYQHIPLNDNDIGASLTRKKIISSRHTQVLFILYWVHNIWRHCKYLNPSLILINCLTLLNSKWKEKLYYQSQLI
ncbi:hypothetical protein H6G97_30020 [Nostoc flagelliforme FACHB-838]|uniref:Malonyl-CoA:ACP transacylase (MAT) domain-containing protein n=1 Tax=Nostoc flagelliforme FACHB-838 TaxID=2692904 RepID=A0ABR8DWG7_9NOSO|nr:hypothetical protein [Nostoc flagelliforme FACHB-838]